MRQCPYCGRDCDDSALECPIDRTSLETAALPASASGLKITTSGKISLIAGLVGNGAIVALCIPLLMLRRGTIVGGTSWAVPGIVVACCVCIAGLPTALISFRSCSRWVSISGLLLSVSPWLLWLVLLNLIAAVCGLQIAP